MRFLIPTLLVMLAAASSFAQEPGGIINTIDFDAGFLSGDITSNPSYLTDDTITQTIASEGFLFSAAGNPNNTIFNPPGPGASHYITVVNNTGAGLNTNFNDSPQGGPPGTPYLMADLGDSIVVASADGSDFGLFSVRMAGFRNDGNLAGTAEYVDVIGTKSAAAGGGLVNYTFDLASALGSSSIATTDDFLTVQLPASFASGLAELVFQGRTPSNPSLAPRFSLDGFAFITPEPASLAIWLLVGIGGLAAWKRRRAKKLAA